MIQSNKDTYMQSNNVFFKKSASLNQEKIHGKLVTGAWSICLSNKNHHFRALLVSYQVQTAGTEEKSRGGAGNRGEEQGRSREQRRGAGNR